MVGSRPLVAKPPSTAPKPPANGPGVGVPQDVMQPSPSVRDDNPRWMRQLHILCMAPLGAERAQPPQTTFYGIPTLVETTYGASGDDALLAVDGRCRRTTCDLRRLAGRRGKRPRFRLRRVGNDCSA